MAQQFNLGSQNAWFYDLGHWGGYFHTYDNFEVGGKSRQVHVFLPRDYEVSQKSYPVLYLNDGNTAFFSGGQYHKTWHFAEIITKLYLRNQIRKVIVVATAPTNRNYEYTHVSVQGEGGGLNDYSEYLAHNVKGFIDNHYKTNPHPEYNLILGASHGGLAAFYTATKYPDKFGGVAALSPSFWFGLDNHKNPQLSQLLTQSLADSILWFTIKNNLSKSARRLKIYLDWGLIREGGFHNEFIEEKATVRGREMRDLLIRDLDYRINGDLFVVEDTLGQHHEESWSGRLPNILSLFFGW
jgi:predicted alpha/beta superfamily hydrolase